jgi:LuxR family transcriptional regulator, maltose regulon positive regulatory protein
MLTIVEEQSSEASPSDFDDPLLELRFELPRPPRQHVERPRLLSRLDEGADLPLTLVSAPAGSGKTTLVAAWVAARTSLQDIGWVTFEPGDESPGRFWPLVIESLRRCGLALRGEVARPQGTDRRMLIELSAALSRSSRPLTLVLDGFEIADAGLGTDVDFLLSHAGDQLRLVLLTRADPGMPLHRLRLQESMVELRMADLSFTEEETARLLDQAGVSLSPGSLTTLLGRTR